MDRKFDPNEVATLLHIHAEASKHPAQLKNVKDAAMDRLCQIDSFMAKVPKEQQPALELKAEPNAEGGDMGAGAPIVRRTAVEHESAPASDDPSKQGSG